MFIALFLSTRDHCIIYKLATLNDTCKLRPLGTIMQCLTSLKSLLSEICELMYHYDIHVFHYKAFKVH